MPKYTFECDGCDEIQEIESSIKDYNDIDTKCSCGGHLSRAFMLERVSVIGEPRTVGMLAEKNARDRKND